MKFDVVIIGAGAGGSFAAHRLCELGHKVALLDRGPKFDPSADYIQNYPDWEVRENPLNNAEKPETSIDRSFRPFDPELGRERASFKYHRVFGLGGSTLHYQGEAHRFPEHSFNIKSLYGWGLDWPINYKDLAPYYEQAENLLGVAGETGNPFKAARGEFPCKAHPLSEKSQWFAKSAKELGFTLLPNTLALPTHSVDGRTPCQRSGGCNYGCVFGAKSSTDQAIIPKAEKTGNLNVFSDTRVMEIEYSITGEPVAVLTKSKEVRSRIEADRFIFAAGGLETPRLMLNSTHEKHANGFANELDQVGRYFMETVLARDVVTLDAPFRTYEGPPLDARVWDFNKPKDDSTAGFVLGVAGYLYPGNGPISTANRIAGLGRAHKQAMRRNFGQQVHLFAIAEQEPQADNRITLSEQKDADGIPKVRSHCVYSARDKKTITKMQQVLRAWSRKTPGAMRRSSSSTLTRPSATHIGGACRMGDDPNFSVTDAYGKIHGSDNTYITDASVFPTQGCGDSPSLTIQALALRTAEKISDDIKQA